jgi:hypothetical protein
VSPYDCVINAPFLKSPPASITLDEQALSRLLFGASSFFAAVRPLPTTFAVGRSGNLASIGGANIAPIDDALALLFGAFESRNLDALRAVVARLPASVVGDVRALCVATYFSDEALSIVLGKAQFDVAHRVELTCALIKNGASVC